MTNSEARKIINSYKPTEGYADLSVKPDKLSYKEYAEVLKMQSNLLTLKTKKFFDKPTQVLNNINPVRYEIFKKNYEKDYKTIVLEYWNISESGMLNDNS